MSKTPAELAADIERRNAELTTKIDDLLKQQVKLQAEISQLQRKKNQADRPRIAELKATRKDATTMIGVLAATRTELLDGLPIITDAAGELDVVAEELAKDAKLIKRAAQRLKKIAETIQKAEKLVVKIISILKPIAL